jgi:hypothetical protein
MKRMKKYNYKLKTCSKLSLSPRDSAALLYPSMENKTEPNGASNDNKIIYPFYQYGSYEEYKPKTASYYIPGSSIKGALGISGNEKRMDLMIDDIPIKNNDLVPEKLCKVQHIESGKKEPISLGSFFQNITVEMLKHGKTYDADLFSSVDPCGYFQKAQEETKERLNQLKTRVREYDDREKTADCKCAFEELTKNLENKLKQIEKNESGTYILLLGGYKGLMLSRKLIDEKQESAIYIDKSCCLPYGLVQIQI